MSVLLSLSACAAGAPSSTVQAAATTKAGRFRGRYCMSISFVSAVGRWPVVRCGISQLPDQRRAEFVDRLADQIRGLVFIRRVEVGLHVAHDLCVTAARGHLVADGVSVVQGSLSVGECGGRS